MRWARDAVDELYAIGDSLYLQPRLSKTCLRLLEKSSKFYEHFLDEKSTDPEIRHMAGRTAGLLAKVYGQLHEPDKAEITYEKSIHQLDRLVADYPDNVVFSKSRARLSTEKANYLRDHQRLAEAELAFITPFVLMSCWSGPG